MVKKKVRQVKAVQGVGHKVDPQLQYNIPVEVEEAKKITHKEVFGSKPVKESGRKKKGRRG